MGQKPAVELFNWAIFLSIFETWKSLPDIIIVNLSAKSNHKPNNSSLTAVNWTYQLILDFLYHHIYKKAGKNIMLLQGFVIL